IIETDLFSELSASLKSELYTLLYWGTRLERMEDKCRLLMKNKPRRRRSRRRGCSQRTSSEEEEAYLSSFYFRGSRGGSLESGRSITSEVISYEDH
ncbi:Uncharacterized protein FKW44_004966, partial [Caligus rogercresseyi]